MTMTTATMMVSGKRDGGDSGDGDGARSSVCHVQINIMSHHTKR